MKLMIICCKQSGNWDHLLKSMPGNWALAGLQIDSIKGHFAAMFCLLIFLISGNFRNASIQRPKYFFVVLDFLRFKLSEYFLSKQKYIKLLI